MNRGRTNSNLDRDAAIRKFLDVTKDSGKRLKALKQAYEKGFENEQQFYEQHYSLIFYVFYDAFLTFELSNHSRLPKQRRALEATPSEKDEFFTATIYFTMESILFMLPHKIHERWQYHSIHGIIKELIHKENTRLIRKRGIKLLVLWLLCLQESTTDRVLDTFGSLIPFFPPQLTPSLRHSSPSSELRDTPTPIQSSPVPSPSDMKHSLSPQGSKRRHDWVRPVHPSPLCRDRGSISEDSELTTALELLDYLMNCLVNLVGYHRWGREDFHTRGLHYLFYRFKQHYISPIFPEAACSKDLFPEWVNYHKNDSTFFRLPVTSPNNLNHSPTPTPSLDSSSSSSSNLYKLTYDLRDSVYADLQNAVVSKLLSWIEPEKLTHNTSAVFHSRDCFINGKENVLRILYTRPENIMLLHDILHQTFKLPCRFQATIATVVRLFEAWCSPLPEDQFLPPFLRAPIPIINPTATSLSGDSSGDSRTLLHPCHSLSQQPLLPPEDLTSSLSTLEPLRGGDDDSQEIFSVPHSHSSQEEDTLNLGVKLDPPSLFEIQEREEEVEQPVFSFPPREHPSHLGYLRYDMVWSIAYGTEPWDETSARIGIQKNLRLFITHSSRLLLVSSERQGEGEGDTQEVVTTCRTVLKFYQQLARMCIPDGDSWQHLLSTLLDVVGHLYREDSLSDSESRRSPASSILSESIHSTVFGLFVRMCQLSPPPPHLWDRLQTTYSGLTEQKSVLSQWSALVRGLSFLLAYYVYEVDMLNRPLSPQLDQGTNRKPQSMRKRSGTGTFFGGTPRPELKPAHSSQALESQGRDPSSLLPTPSLEEKTLLSSLTSTDTEFFGELVHLVAYKGRTHPALDKVRRKRATGTTSGTSSQSSHSPQSSNTSTPQLSHPDLRPRASSKESQGSDTGSGGVAPGCPRDGTRVSRPYSTVEHSTEETGPFQGADTRCSFPSGPGPGGGLRRQGSGGLRSSFRHQSLLNLLTHSDTGTDRGGGRQKSIESRFLQPIKEELRLQRISDCHFLLTMLFLPVLSLNFQLAEQGERLVLVSQGSNLEESIGQESFIRENSGLYSYLLPATWDTRSVADVWRRMLGILRNPSHIKNEKLLSQAFSSLAFIWQVFDDVTTHIIYAKRAQPDLPCHYPPALHFSSWLYQGCVLSPEYKEGTKTCYELLCKTHLSDKFPTPSPSHLRALYSLLQQGYTHRDTEIVQTCVKHSCSLFLFPLPGLTALLGPALAAVRTLLQGSNNTLAPMEALTFLSNLLSLSRLYPDSGEGEGPSLLSQLIQLLDYVAQNHHDSSCRNMVIYQLTLFIFQTLSSQEQDRPPGYPSLIKTSLVDLLFFFHSDPPLHQSAVDMVDLLAALYPQISQVDPGLPVVVIKSISLSITTHLLSKHLRREQLVRSLIPLLHCLSSWLLASPLLQLLRSDPCYPPLLQNLLSILAAISDNSQVSVGVQDFFKEGVPEMNARMSRLASTISFRSPVRADLEWGTQDPLNIEVNSVLTTLFHFLGHFPFGPGVAWVSCQVEEPMDLLVPLERDELDLSLFKNPCVQFYTYNDRTILTLVEVRPDASELPCNMQTYHSHVRVIVRDATGKFSWDVCSMHSLHSHFSQVTNFADVLSMHSESTDTTSYLDSQDSILSQSHRETEEFSVPAEQPGEDPLLSLLTNLTQSSPEVLEHRCSLSAPMPCTRILSHASQEPGLLSAIEQQWVHEQEYVESDSTPTLSYPLMEEVLESSRHSLFASCLSLLSQMGFFMWENRSKLHLLNKRPSLLSELKALDKTGRAKTNYTCRHHYKIGVIYISAGQEEQEEILKNTSGSKQFNNFVESLGWQVETKSHTGYGGLMSENQSKKLTYFADATKEVVFHVSTRILTTSQRGNDIKIQHIGNDDVVVFWSEHWHEYRRSQFKTEFMDIIIIIYPLSNGLYRIQINKRPEHKQLTFGPLHDGALVIQESLAPLVRATAINALRAYKTKLVSFPNVRCNERARKIASMIKVYKKRSTFEEFLAESLVPSGPDRQPTRSAKLRESESNFNLLGETAEDESDMLRQDSEIPYRPTKLMMRAKDSVTGNYPEVNFLQQESKSVRNSHFNRTLSHPSDQFNKAYSPQLKGKIGNQHEHRL